MIKIESHPLLDVAWIAVQFPLELGDTPACEEVLSLLTDAARSSFRTNADIKKRVRDMMRHGGYQPTGRGKPSSEYLIKAVSQGRLGSINPAVDVCNVVSLHSGLPISVVDLDYLAEPLSIAIAGEGEQYVFNASGQSISLGGLVCLFDSSGPCANGVKDSQRTKTSASTKRTLSVIWGARELPDVTQKTLDWYRRLLQQTGATELSGLMER